MLKPYKAIFNKNEMLVEKTALNKNKVIQDTKTTNKNQYEINIVATDVLDCLTRAKDIFFNQFNYHAKSIEIVKMPMSKVLQSARELRSFRTSFHSMSA